MMGNYRRKSPWEALSAGTKAAPVKHHGLINQAATCYLNSLLQVLFMTRRFREAVLRHTHHLDPHLRDLFDELQQRTAFTHSLTNVLGTSRVWEEQDAAECFQKIVTLSSPEASQIFRGQLTHTNKCSKCNKEKKANSYFWLLPLALKDKYSVVDAVRDYFADSHFSGLDQIYCEECDDKVDAIVKCEVKHHPEVLVLLLKRFEYLNMTYVKNNRAVNVPFTLQIPESQTYELYAVVDHAGDLRGGHYAATIKDQDEDRWYNFNDERVTLSRPFRPKNSKTAYLLFYKKQEQVVTKKEQNKRRHMKKRTLFGLFMIFIIVNIFFLLLSNNTLDNWITLWTDL